MEAESSSDDAAKRERARVRQMYREFNEKQGRSVRRGRPTAPALPPSRTARLAILDPRRPLSQGNCPPGLLAGSQEIRVCVAGNKVWCAACDAYHMVAMPAPRPGRHTTPEERLTSAQLDMKMAQHMLEEKRSVVERLQAVVQGHRRDDVAVAAAAASAEAAQAATQARRGPPGTLVPPRGAKRKRVVPQCEDCHQAPRRFGMDGEKPRLKRWCLSCVAAHPGALDFGIRICEDCNNKTSSFGLPRDYPEGPSTGALGKARWCKTCSVGHEGAVDLVHVKKCEDCRLKQPRCVCTCQPRAKPALRHGSARRGSGDACGCDQPATPSLARAVSARQPRASHAGALPAPGHTSARP